MAGLGGLELILYMHEETEVIWRTNLTPTWCPSLRCMGWDELPCTCVGYLHGDGMENDLYVIQQVSTAVTTPSLKAKSQPVSMYSFQLLVLPKLRPVSNRCPALD